MHDMEHAPDFDRTQTLPELHALLDGVQMKNGWAKPTPSMYPQPKQPFVPAHWRYAHAHAALHAAGRLVGTEWAERRNLIMANPVPGNHFPTVNSLVAAYQMVKAGETARSHRHMPNAMRIALDSKAQTYTIVEGVKVPMEPGDVLLTPNWCYHGHSNEADVDAYWIDILDSPTVHLLGPMFFEHHPQAVSTDGEVAPDSPMRVAYADYRPRLAAQPEMAPGVRTLALAPGVLPTFDRTAIELATGARWSPGRSTASEIFVVIEGQGRSQFDDCSFSWERGDIVAVPYWTAATHTSEGGDAVLLRMSDRPMLDKLGWLREESVVS
ncbi:cupin domain-containing protein [Hydrogenophaga sp. BPS33]|uniref:cupin domain-containing protein n=1 Tax=Hydrogenophaga sp. BPS33 TaxID=2651974 RepID=UPI00131FAC92|nr:cupin domain-containing protein [Hydrogenophaga sp. BPS33]QHE84174.1 cupin domain-containing protein [Hydrogenophaga sp. BPS33]